MSNETDENKVDFLKYNISYLENRIRFIDNKASLLIAIQGGFLGLLMVVFKQIFPKCHTSNIEPIGYMVVGGAFLIIVITIFTLVMTIRPTKCPFSLEIDLLPEGEVTNHVMWFNDKDGFPNSVEDYNKRIDSLKALDFLDNYKRTHFILLQLIRKKYRYYRWCILLIKIVVVWSAVGFAIIILLKALSF